MKQFLFFLGFLLCLCSCSGIKNISTSQKNFDFPPYAEKTKDTATVFTASIESNPVISEPTLNSNGLKDSGLHSESSKVIVKNIPAQIHSRKEMRAYVHKAIKSLKESENGQNPENPKWNTLGVLSFIFSLLFICFIALSLGGLGFALILAPLSALLALIFGGLSLHQFNRHKGKFMGAFFAWFGLVLGSIEIIISIPLIFLIILLQ